MRLFKTTLASVSVLALLSGCSTGFHYSELKGERFHRTNLDTFPVSITQIDGRSTPMTGRILVEPGLREITVQGPPGGAGRSERLTTQLKIDVCTRYWLVAVRDNRLASEFELRVDHWEPLPGCTPPPA